MIGLRARVRRLDGDADLLAFAGDDGYLFDRDGTGLAGREVALRVPGDEVTGVLASIEVDPGPGVDLDDVTTAGPVAFGALPFDPDDARRAELVIPRHVLARDVDGRCTLTTIGDATTVPTLDVRREAAAPDAFTLTSSVSHADWLGIVDAALNEIKDGGLGKVVLAREVVVGTNRPIPVGQVLARLQALYPSCTVFSVDGFVGASPELLVARSGHQVASYPMAGTIAHSGDPEVDGRAAARMMASAKEREEHALVVDDVAAALLPLCDELDVPDAPSIVAMRNVAHLGSLVGGTLRDPAPTALELALRLHPTPAVGGTPTDAALAFLAETEGLDRGRYAGPVGWVDARGDGAFLVGIRSAEIDGDRARLFAGVGIVDGSVPDDELAETQLKLQALLAALVRP